jgi:phosphate starvation-inducible protein PhoH
VRGASWTARFVIVDECQNLTINEIQTLMTRLGKFTKMILCADSAQSDLPKAKQGGFEKCSHMFNTIDAEKFGIYSVAFNNDDIMRSELCKFIVKTFEDNAAILAPSAK